jgi:uncharacterized protein
MNQTTASPQPPNGRADILDITRGFALLGICLANYFYSSLYIFQKKEYTDALATADIDWWLSRINLALIDGKFYSLFSLLFGIGFSIIFLRNKKAGKNGLKFFYRRLFILLIIGLCHSLLLWDGDILVFYAIVGMLLPLFRNSSDKALLITAVVLIVSPILFDALKVVSDGKWNISNPVLATVLARDKMIGVTESNTYNWLIVHDRYSDLLDWCLSGTLWGWQMRLDSNRIPKVLAMFLVGLYAGRHRIFAQLQDYKRLFKKMQLWGLVIGLPSGVAHAWFELDGKRLPAAAGLWDTASYALNVVPLAMAYAATLALWYLNPVMKRKVLFMRPVGRMALTNYIMQSFLGVAIFWGIGAGIGGKIGPAVFLSIALAVWLLQVLYSTWWFKHFTYGPLEWIWRMLTYGKRLPLRKQRT